MPEIYLSPSTQEYNEYNGGGTEEQYMNFIADAMEPYLIASGIKFKRNKPEMTAGSSIIASNQGHYDLHLALHSNAVGGDATPGSSRGSLVFYYPTSANGKRAAEIISNNLKLIYPLPDEVKTVSTTSLGEISKTRAPSVLIEFAFHDNADDANWIRNNINAIAENIVLSLTDYFDIPFNVPTTEGTGTVKLHYGGNLNIREKPTVASKIIGKIPNGEKVKIISEKYDWYLVEYKGNIGYVKAEYIAK